MWNIPNTLTMLRIFMVPLLVVVLLTKFPNKEFWGLGIFLLAALTDLVDGIIARRTNRITVTGALLDPLADKILMSAAFISLVEMKLAPSWIVTCIVAREFAVTALRLVAIEHKMPIEANIWGKAKTVSQVIAVAFLIVANELGEWRVLADVALWVALALTIYSMGVYFWQNRHIVSGDIDSGGSDSGGSDSGGSDSGGSDSRGSESGDSE